MDTLKLAIEKSSISVVTFVKVEKNEGQDTSYERNKKNRHTKHSEGHLSLCKTIK